MSALRSHPGANLAVVLRCASQGGQRAAVGATIGLTVGKVLWAIASLVGLAALLAASATAYQMLKLAGAAYLVHLGIQSLLSARCRAAEAGRESAEADARERLTPAGGLRRGLIGDLLNPKVGLFYTTVFPQFIEPGAAVAPAALVLLVTHAVVLLTWYPGVAYLISRLGRAFHRPYLTRGLERVTGTVLIALGARVAVAAR